MRRKIWMAVLSLALILVFLVIIFNYTPKEQEIKEGILVENTKIREYEI